jgi:hypothetical protein
VKKKASSSTTTKKPPSGSKTTRKPKDGSVPKPNRTTKARSIVEESKEASPKVTRAKRSTTQDGKQDGKRSPTKNRSKSKLAPWRHCLAERTKWVVKTALVIVVKDVIAPMIVQLTWHSTTLDSTI